MPMFWNIQVFCENQEEDLHGLTNRLTSFFREIGVMSEEIETWSESYALRSAVIGLSSGEFPDLIFQEGEVTFTGRLLIIFFELPQSSHYMLDISVLLDDDILYIRDVGWKKNAASLIWKLLRQFSQEFRESGAYFTDEEQDGKPGHAMYGNGERFWAFDAAIVPEELLIRFGPIPEGYVKKDLGSNMWGVVLAEWWHILPWDM